MKQSINPAIAGVLIAIVVIIAGLFIWKGVSPPKHDDLAKPPGMPPEAAAEFQKRMGTASPTGAASAPGNTEVPKSATMMPTTAPGSR